MASGKITKDYSEAVLLLKIYFQKEAAGPFWWKCETLFRSIQPCNKS